MFWSKYQQQKIVIGYEVRVQATTENDLCGTDFCVHGNQYVLTLIR